MISKLRVAQAALFTLVAACCLASGRQACAQSQSNFTYNGINLVSYQANEYLNSNAAATTMRATGGNYAGLVVTQYQQTSTSNVIAPETTSTPNYVSGQNSLTPTDVALVSSIQSLQAQGLIVSLKPQVDSNDGVFRGVFAPTDVNAWFASYQTFILHYAQIAAQNNVGMLVIGTELKSLSGSAYKSYWEQIIAQIRTQYPSLTLVYAANATGAGDEYSTVSFWADVDIIGVDGYVPLTKTNDPTVAALVAAWTSNKNGFNAVQAFHNLQSTYNKPLIFSEVGYVSVSGTNQIPYSNLNGSFDGTEQQNCYEAFFQVFSQETAWMKGVFWWDWSVSTPSATDTGYSPQNKPAASVTLPKWFGNTTAGFTLAPSNSTLLVGQGSTAADTIAITNQGGFSGAVALSLAGLPGGVSGTFTSGSAGTQLLTLTATSAATAGSASQVTVTGTAGALSASTVIALTVAKGPSFALTASSASLSTAQGGSVSTQLSIVPANGFAGSVALSASGLPAGVTAAFTINPATATSMLTLSASSGATLGGPVTVTVNGLSGALTASTTLTLTVTPAPSLTITGPPISVVSGATTGNTSLITVTSTNGFAGTVQLSCAITPVASTNPPTCGLLPNSVTLASGSTQASTLTVSTVATTHSENQPFPFKLPAGGTALAFLGYLGLRKRRVRLPALSALAMLMVMTLAGCAGSSSTSGSGQTIAGTPAGTYVINVMGVSAGVNINSSISLVIQ